MPLRELKIEPIEGAMPRQALELLSLYETQRSSFQAGNTRNPCFVESSPEQFFACYAGLRASGVLKGDQFCEWGSGLGLLTLLADTLGLDSHGIELDPEMVASSRFLACEAGLGSRFACGSFVPNSLGSSFRVTGTFGATRWGVSTETDPYVEIGIPANGFDLIYAYPWPREVDIYRALFDACAGQKALLWLSRDPEPPLFLQKSSP